jgi:hypothetical protein
MARKRRAPCCILLESHQVNHTLLLGFLQGAYGDSRTGGSHVGKAYHQKSKCSTSRPLPNIHRPPAVMFRGTTDGNVHQRIVSSSQRQRSWFRIIGLLLICVCFLFMRSVTWQIDRDSGARALSSSPRFSYDNSFNLFGIKKYERKTVAYVISVTADGTHSDGAAVLAHGIRKASATSKYGVDLIAIVHPNVTTSRAALRRSGWQ